MKIELVDTHAHLTFPEFEKDREEVLARAWEAGLSQIVLVGAGAGLEGNRAALDLARTDPRLFATVGVHPNDADKMDDSWIADLEAMARDPKCVAIGEIGLDFFRRHSDPESQAHRFRQLMKLAIRVDKPAVIHAREAIEEAMKVIEETGAPKRGCVFHCFSGDLALARRIVKEGFFISVPGVVTFRNAKVLREVVAGVPLERILLETDCPYLAPEPHRGGRNEPAYVAEVAGEIARIKKVAIEDVARVTTLNARRLFGLPGCEMETSIAYRIRNSLYLNITNRCNMACTFCPKFTDFEVKGYYLKLEHEPDVEQIFQAVGQPETFDEVVFCGYGEPTLRLEVLKVIARRMKERGAKKVRLNTDGLANLVYGRNVVPELAGLIDSVSVSMNAADAASHASICPSRFGEKAYAAMLDFVLEAKRCIPEVVVTVVALPGLDIEACRKKANDIGVLLRVREYMSVG
ncbi:MAG: YchF/TatD family DNA exonuclease [Proteobacteria bacterium]|nr:YchF/TatD family DNA exonuclease [Pseudomonadota bacterium]